MKKPCTLRHGLLLAGLAVFAVLVVITLRAPAGAALAPFGYQTAWALLPPVTAITLALITKEVYFSLFLGILVGGLLCANGDLELALNTVLYSESGGLVTNIATLQNASILVFVSLLGTMVALMNRSGGSAAFGRWASRHIKSRVGAQLATILWLRISHSRI